MKKYRGGYTGICIAWIVIAILVTFFYTNRSSDGIYQFGGSKFVHNRGIAEYGSSALVVFPVKGNYDDLLNKPIYYFDNKTLKSGYLTEISPSRGNFKIGDEEFDMKGFLGQPSNGFNLLGDILEFLTMKEVYICAIMIPAVLCVGYIVYNSVADLFIKKKK